MLNSIPSLASFPFLANQGGADQAPGWMLLVPIIAVMVLFIWLSSRSQKKKEQEREEMLENISPDDRVMTIGGIYGKVVSVKGERFILRIDDEKDIKIKIAKTGISRRLDDSEQS